MSKFPISPDVVVIAASDEMVHLTVSLVTRSMKKSLLTAIILEELLEKMVVLGLIIKPSHEVRDNGE